MVDYQSMIDFQSRTGIDFQADQCQGEMLIGLWSQGLITNGKIIPKFFYSLENCTFLTGGFFCQIRGQAKHGGGVD